MTSDDPDVVCKLISLVELLLACVDLYLLVLCRYKYHVHIKKFIFHAALVANQPIIASMPGVSDRWIYPLLNGRCTSLLRVVVSEMTYTVSSGTLNSSIPYL